MMRSVSVLAVVAAIYAVSADVGTTTGDKKYVEGKKVKSAKSKSSSKPGDATITTGAKKSSKSSKKALKAGSHQKYASSTRL